ncbi:CDP-diacylglycerol--inositol 3-phosphatidyltransferase-like [Pocillopora damicornis]|uniref:CDP-diacylglycerol--inositol 3-phosphatidyltransferase-like n=1 Tax=Pocillopora damicornis TaxID=46731 RepID=UPI000F55643F|nr:CDP-diacylglycerol--inositol 3-phosphatidyltransferase-like [Pocillopora damicornis]
MDDLICRRENVLLFIPNLIGYVRVILLFASWIFFNNPVLFLCFYTASVLLDGLDGIVARQLNQTSAFGAWLDVATDNLGRGMLWTLLYKWGYFISAVEWMVFVCTHSLGAHWKSAQSNPPSWVQLVMAKGFKTPAGAFAICGLHGLPVWLYGTNKHMWSPFMSHHLQLGVTGILVSGRALCMGVEVWFITSHIKDLLADHEQKRPLSNTEPMMEDTD